MVLTQRIHLFVTIKGKIERIEIKKNIQFRSIPFLRLDINWISHSWASHRAWKEQLYHFKWFNCFAEEPLNLLIRHQNARRVTLIERSVNCVSCDWCALAVVNHNKSCIFIGEMYTESSCLKMSSMVNTKLLLSSDSHRNILRSITLHALFRRIECNFKRTC